MDYDFEDISGHTFLLPIKDETLRRWTMYLSKNDTEFHNYHKYSAESELKFDTDTPDPLPADKTKETPARPLPAQAARNARVRATATAEELGERLTRSRRERPEFTARRRTRRGNARLVRA